MPVWRGLTRFYKFYETSKLGDVDRLLAKVGDSEASFLQLVNALEFVRRRIHGKCVARQ